MGEEKGENSSTSWKLKEESFKKLKNKGTKNSDRLLLFLYFVLLFLKYIEVIFCLVTLQMTKARTLVTAVQKDSLELTI